MAFLGARCLGAGFAHGFERGAGKLVGLAKLRLGRRQPIGGGAPGAGCAFDLADQGLALRGKFLRCIGQFSPFGRSLVAARTERDNLRRRVVPAFGPGLPLAGDGCKPMLRKLRLASDSLRFTPDFRAGGALARNYFGNGGKFQLDFIRSFEAGKRLLGCGVRRIGFVAGGDDTLPRFGKRRDACRIAANLAFRDGMDFARRIGRTLSLAPAIAPFSFCRRCASERRFGGFEGAPFAFDLDRGCGKLAFQRLQTTAFGKAPRRAGWRMRRSSEAVPPPQVAFARHQALAGLECLDELGACRAFDHANLGQATREFGGRFDVLR